ncbi:hypothetical protein LH435_07100 [Laribacter hongkongensis]|uniref:hypothetical protein n=1 Tax=Laribacter hongkongensis TaxID=168471 RepID=UPI001EFC53C5|nr:hypothetical protein [Laribacter hongkongensis]MCG8995498.1 hypothetical protein [Laribacter hongkongensis]MCG9010315.1 hypothetical protein [Laribacter hongkongensis]MCG9046209.1 hypothetical protein [Laribacter hongkongensis]MCG9073781.1 hypothetical protein [Laribacter hongkongensis]
MGAYLRARLSRQQTWYLGESLFMRIARRLLRLPMGRLVENFHYGQLERSTGIRKRAYEQGLVVIASEPLPLKRLDPGFAADMDLLASKFMLDHLFSKYEFQGMAMQFAHEHPGMDVRLVASERPFPTLESNASPLKLIRQRPQQWLSFLLSLFVVPLYLAQLFKQHGVVGDDPQFADQLLCEVDSMPIVDMFQSLFQSRYAPVFFIQPHYLGYFSPEQATAIGLRVHGIGAGKRQRLIALLRGWLKLVFLDARRLARGGLLPFDFFKSLAQGILITPMARRCTYLTFEHMSTVKAARNELLRATGNKSVFVPYNTYAIDHFFVPEFRYNYDVLCSSCELLEKAYRLQQASTLTILRTGAFSPHIPLADELANARQARLAAFKGDCLTVTILSTGVTQQSASSEAKLIRLARELAAQAGVKVFVRQKPTVPEARYAHMYGEGLKDLPNVLLTHAEYKLFDFLPVTDLFVTSSSSAAVDLCSAGGDFFSIDFWDDRDLYLWQTEVDGVYLAPERALATIMDYLRADTSGAREQHSQRMQVLRKLIAFPAGSFEAYHKRLLEQLGPWLPAAKDQVTHPTTSERATT